MAFLSTLTASTIMLTYEILTTNIDNKSSASKMFSSTFHECKKAASYEGVEMQELMNGN